MVLYVDSALLGGFILNLLSLDSAISVTGTIVKKRKLVLGAFVLSVLSIFNLFVPYIRILYIFVYILGIRFVFGKCSALELLRRVFVGIGCSLLYQAMLLAFIPTEKMWILHTETGQFFVPEDIYFYLPLTAVYLGVKTIMFFITKTKKVFSVSLRIGGKEKITQAIVDTGNSLRDRETGKPVIIAEQSLFDFDFEDGKTIPFKNIGEEMGYTKIYPAEKLVLLEEHKEFNDIYVALVNRPLSSSGKFKVLLHNSFIK